MKNVLIKTKVARDAIRNAGLGGVPDCKISELLQKPTFRTCSNFLHPR